MYHHECGSNQENSSRAERNCSNVTDPSSGDALNFYSHDDFSYGLSREYVIRLNKQVQELFEHKPYEKRFSKKFINKKLRKIIVKSFESEGLNFEEEIQLLDKELENLRDSQEVYLAVDGLVLSQCFTLGHVKFTPGDDCFLDFIQERAKYYLEKSKGFEEYYGFYLEEFKNRTDQEFKGSCVAIVSVVGEPVRAHEIAKEEIRKVIDLLRYTNKLLVGGNDTRIGLRGDYPVSSQGAILFSEKNFRLKSESIGANRFEINQGIVDIMEKLSIFKLADAFLEESLNGFQKAILQSIHWFSLSFAQDEKDNALLCLIISLESLFPAESWSSIGSTIAESTAFVLADEIEVRKEIIREIKDFYGKRSSIVHGGTKASKLVTDSDLKKLTQWVLAVIKFCLGKMDEFKSRGDLATWIQDLKLS